MELLQVAYIGVAMPVYFFAAMFFQWLDRKIYAHYQHRVGPYITGPHGILQPIADLIKLLSKEQVIPEGSDEPLIRFMAVLAPSLGFFALLYIPFCSDRGLLSMQGDLILVMAISVLIGLISVVVGYSVAGPYSNVGAARAAELIISYEIPFMLSVVSVAILVGGFSMTDVVSGHPGIWGAVLPVLSLLLAFGIYVFSAVAKVEKVPFDIPEAETEIAAGWQTELSGRLLAMFKLALDLKYLLVSALGAVLFLGGPQPFVDQPLLGFVVFLLKTLFVAFLITTVRSIVARYRIDQALSLFWKYLIPLGMLSVVASLLFRIAGVV